MSTSTLPLLAITMGDPAGIGPEIIAKALAGPRLRKLCRPVVVGSREVMEQTARALKLKLTGVTIADPLPTPLGRFRPGVAADKTGAASVSFIKTAARMALEGAIDGIVTAPINKEAIHLSGCHFPGHTELLADLTGSKEVGMMFVGGPLKVLLASIHLAVRDLSEYLTPERIGTAIRAADLALRESFGIRKPRIGIAALNPHAGEAGLFGDEEERHLLPAVKRARQAGVQASDPLPADTLFVKAARGEYDGVVAMYHDQALIPLKLVAFGTCVNMTVGLPIIRTSVDHGTAYDIVGKGIADPGSLISAVKLASELATRRRRK